MIKDRLNMNELNVSESKVNNIEKKRRGGVAGGGVGSFDGLGLGGSHTFTTDDFTEKA